MTTLAKLSSKNQITLPVDIVRGFPGVEYFEVVLSDVGIELRPLRIPKAGSALAEARQRFKEKGFDEDTITEAVRWARKAAK
jgi:hypothetical protein